MRGVSKMTRVGGVISALGAVPQSIADPGVRSPFEVAGRELIEVCIRGLLDPLSLEIQVLDNV